MLAADLSDIAIKLADEGVPTRAIGRALHISAEILQPQFERAKLTGRLVDLPRSDWPPGTPRRDRVPDLAPISDIDEDVLKAWIMQAFAMTAGQARMFLALIRRREVHRDQLHSIYNERDGEIADTEVKIVDVQICMMRKLLKDKEIEIRTLWSFGYCMTTANRRRALELLLAGLGRTTLLLEDELKNAPD